MKRHRLLPLRRSTAVPVALLSIVVALVLGGRFAVQPYRVAGASMAPTLAEGELLLVDRLAYRLGHPDRGDVVVFTVPGSSSATIVKRIVALPGETVEVRDGVVTVAGVPLVEPYLAPDTRTVCGGVACSQTVPAGQVYVLGDNRGHSADSRFFGTVPLDAVVGEAIELS